MSSGYVKHEITFSIFFFYSLTKSMLSFWHIVSMHNLQTKFYFINHRNVQTSFQENGMGMMRSEILLLLHRAVIVQCNYVTILFKLNMQ